MTDDGSNSDGETLDLFTEPADYYPPSPKPTTQTHVLLSGELLTLRLVGHNPLWGHHLWQAGRLISNYLEKNPSLVANKTILELGSGAGLPSLTSYHLGAKLVVCTDYPDPDLVQNIQINIDNYISTHQPSTSKAKDERKILARGYAWGADPEPLLSLLSSDDPKFDILILADLLFNHTCHTSLLQTVQLTLSKSAESKALVFFSPYRPWLYDKDMDFFRICREGGMVVEKIFEEKMEKVMFVEDRGDEELRRMVFGWVVRWPLEGEVAGGDGKAGETEAKAV